MTFLAGYDHSTKSVLVILLTQENNLFTKICAVPVYWNILEYVGYDGTGLVWWFNFCADPKNGKPKHVSIRQFVGIRLYRDHLYHFIPSIPITGDLEIPHG